jgi:hypothetical protein
VNRSDIFRSEQNCSDIFREFLSWNLVNRVEIL